ncbi:putative ribonuclease H-like domain-containing protein [Tanacetum coccineum]
MELENTQNNALAKLPMLKLEENSWVLILVTTPSETGTSTTTKMTVPSTIEEKTCKKNDVDAQSMSAVIKARFGGNEATKKTQKALLKQQYENFSASSSESLDSIFNRLQKLVSRLAILVEYGTTKHGARKVLSENWKEIHHWMEAILLETRSIDNRIEIKGGVDMAEEEIQANWASWHSQILRREREAATYKRGLATLEGQIVKYREHEVLFSKEIALLKRSLDDLKNWRLGVVIADEDDNDEPNPKVKKKTVIPTATKKEFVKPVKRPFRSTVNTVRAGDFNAVKPSHVGFGDYQTQNVHSQLNNKGLLISGLLKAHDWKTITFLSDSKTLIGGYVTFGEIENLVDKKVKIIRSDNGTEFKNKVMDEFCREKGINREYSVARTPQQNGVAKRKNRTLIEADRIMVLIVKPHNKTLYELFRGIKPAIGFMKPFGCHVTILNTLDKLGKFNGKSDEGFFVGYSLSSKAFRVYNIRTKKVQENLHIGFLENKPMIEGNGPKWLFDLDSLTQSMNYVPVVAGTFSNDFAGIQGVSESSTSSQQDQDNQDCIVMPI